MPTNEASNPALAGTINRLRASRDAREREALFLGTNSVDGTPIIVPRSIFNEHAHLLGDSGSGKTSLGITSLISQLIEFGDSSLVVIDLKADDLALFEATREGAEEIDKKLKARNPADASAGYPFRWFTNEIERATYAFNILQQSCFESRTAYQKADILTAAMGLQYGTDYGRAFYADANTELLHQALASHPQVASFAELADAIENSTSVHLSHELRRAASHLQAVVSRLGTCEAINAVDPDKYHPAVLENAIDLAQVFTTPQVLYFHLPSLIGTTSSAEIARFVVHMLLASSKAVGPKRKQVYLFIDEFQRITASNLEIILQTARSMNVGVILANQTMSDLKTSGVDLIPTVEANTRYRQIFSASDLSALRQIVDSSGETIIHSRAWTEYLGMIGILGGGWSRAYSETISPRLRPNDVILASDHPLQSIVYVRRGKDYAQFGGFPFVMTSSHSVSKDLYEKRQNADWPSPRQGTLVPTHPSDYSPASPQSSSSPPSAGPPESPILSDTPPKKPTPPDEALAPEPASPESADSPSSEPTKDPSNSPNRRRKRSKKTHRPQDKYRKPPQTPPDIPTRH